MFIVTRFLERLRRAKRLRHERTLLADAKVAQSGDMRRGPVLQTAVEQMETRRRVEAELVRQRERRSLLGMR